MLVVDASAIVESLTRAQPNRTQLQLLREDELHAPTLVDYEVASATRGLLLARRLRESDVVHTISEFEALKIRRHSFAGLTAALLDLRHNFTAYDAAYVVLAKALRAPLVTADAKMLEAEKLGVEVRVFG